MVATAPIDFEKSLIAPIYFDNDNLKISIDFDNFHVKVGVTKKPHPSIEIPKEDPVTDTLKKKEPYYRGP